jgi:hypothetical protein
MMWEPKLLRLSKPPNDNASLDRPIAEIYLKLLADSHNAIFVYFNLFSNVEDLGLELVHRVRELLAIPWKILPVHVYFGPLLFELRRLPLQRIRGLCGTAPNCLRRAFSVTGPSKARIQPSLDGSPRGAIGIRKGLLMSFW